MYTVRAVTARSADTYGRSTRPRRLRQLYTWSSWQPRDDDSRHGDPAASPGDRGSLSSPLEALIKSLIDLIGVQRGLKLVSRND